MNQFDFDAAIESFNKKKDIFILHLKNLFENYQTEIFSPCNLIDYFLTSDLNTMTFQIILATQYNKHYRVFERDIDIIISKIKIYNLRIFIEFLDEYRKSDIVARIYEKEDAEYTHQSYIIYNNFKISYCLEYIFQKTKPNLKFIVFHTRFKIPVVTDLIEKGLIKRLTSGYYCFSEIMKDEKLIMKLVSIRENFTCRMLGADIPRYDHYRKILPIIHLIIAVRRLKRTTFLTKYLIKDVYIFTL